MEWVRGFFEVDPQLVRVPQPQDEAFRTKGYDRTVMETWIADVPSIRARQAVGWSERDFEALRRSPDPSARRIGTTYDRLFREGSTTAIRLNWLGTHYEAEDGNKRIWLAQQAGIAAIPAIVKAPDRETLEKLRSQAPGRAERVNPPRRRNLHPARGERTRERGR